MDLFPSTITIFLALFLIVILWYIQFYLTRIRLYKLLAQYNGPRPYPIIGHLFKTPLTEFIQKILKGCSYYKSPTKLWFGPYFSVQVWDPENVKIVLNSPHALEKEPYLYGLFQTIIGPGLAVYPVNTWKRHRKLIAPIFNHKDLPQFFDTFVIHSKRLVKEFESNVDKGIFNVYSLVVKHGMDSIAGTILGIESVSTQTSTPAMLDSMESIWTVITTRMTSVCYFPDFIFKMSALSKTLALASTNYRTVLSSAFTNWEEESIKKVKANGYHVNKEGPFKPRNIVDFLPSTLEGTGKFTLQELRDEAKHLFFAGFETLSSTLGYALVMLGLHPEIQEKVFQEITEIIGNKNQLEYGHLKKLEYLDRVIKETLRFYPGMLAVARYNNNEIQLSHHTIPAYTSIIIVISALHMDPKIWPNPTEFNPDRFLPEEEAKRHPYSYIPFSAGSRNCIAEKFGLINIKIALSLLLLNYKVGTNYKNVEDIKLTMVTVLKPTKGYNISITSRETRKNIGQL